MSADADASFEEWWFDHKCKNGMIEATGKRNLALAAWRAACTYQQIVDGKICKRHGAWASKDAIELQHVDWKPDDGKERT